MKHYRKGRCGRVSGYSVLSALGMFKASTPEMGDFIDEANVFSIPFWHPTSMWSRKFSWIQTGPPIFLDN